MRERIFTTGELARRLGVAPRTVCGWADSGRLSHYRLPYGHGTGGAGDRRYPATDVRRFLLANGMPTDWLDDAGGRSVLLVSSDDALASLVERTLADTFAVDRVSTFFGASAAWALRDYAACVVDTAVDCTRAPEFLRYMSESSGLRQHLVALSCGESPDLIDGVCILSRTAWPDQLRVAVLTGLSEPPHPLEPGRWIKGDRLLALTGLTPREAGQRAKYGTFPQPRRGPRGKLYGWLRDDVEAWVKEQAK